MTILTIARLTVARDGPAPDPAVLLGLTIVSVALTTWGIERLVIARARGRRPSSRSRSACPRS